MSRTVSKDFATKRCWGMAPDELPTQDFSTIMQEELENAKLIQEQNRKDKELATRLQKELTEEEMLQQAIAASLADQSFTDAKLNQKLSGGQK